MRKYVVILLVFLVSILGCAQPSVPVVTLESPANGGSVSSLTPILAWNSIGVNASYRLQVATDGNLQNLIIDVADLPNPSYSVPSGKLANGKTYYWHVNASEGEQVSPWSTCWAFQTAAATSTIVVNATLDGTPWSGTVSYTITGPQTDSAASVAQSFSNLPAGSYTVSYSSGGPPGATLASITPLPIQTVSSGGTITFTLNFHSEANGTIEVNALLDGEPWQTAVGSGPISYGITGPRADASTSMPDTFGNLPIGTYTLTYHSGGPIGATLTSISPSPTQAVSSGGTITFTLNFHAQPRGTVTVNATLNGAPWSGVVGYTVSGPYMDSSSSVPGSFSGCPAGSYTVTYTSGGPPQSLLDNITPSPTQTLSAGGTLTFTLNFTFQSGLQ